MPSPDRPIYTRSPIAEAIIDIQIEPTQGFDVAALYQVADQFKADYPDQSEGLLIKEEFLPNGDHSQVQRKTGLMLKNRPIGSDQVATNVFQVRVNGFTLSRLPPYERWEPFLAEAQRLWAAYKECTRPVRITRVAVRYINVFRFDSKDVNIRELFVALPVFDAELGLNNPELAMQFRAELADGAKVVINQGVPKSPEDSNGFVVDIDVYDDRERSTDSGLWDRIIELHDDVESLFNLLISEAGKELIR